MCDHMDSRIGLAVEQTARIVLIYFLISRCLDLRRLCINWLLVGKSSAIVGYF